MSLHTPNILGLVARRERWGLTVRGWGLMLLAVGVGGLVVVRTIHPFLAVTVPVESPVVVVEAWVPPAILKGMATRFEGDRVSVFYCTGGPTDKKFDSTAIEDTSAAEAAQLLQGYGISGDRLKVVPTWIPRRDRTYSNAVALREWLAANGIDVKALNVVTEGPHGRRSRLMFEAAFGPTVEVGIISITDPTYDATRWWRYSEGIKAVISETAAYLHARFLFHPGHE